MNNNYTVGEVGVSVIVCCYNSAVRLPETLKHLALQKVKPILNWEVILVDNASTDHSAQVAKEEWNRYSVSAKFSVLSQPIPGLANARSMGLENAQYKYILFCDDDNHLFDQYLQKGIELLETKPEVGILGGLPLPQLEFYPGKWIEQVYSAMAIGPRANQSGCIDWVYGAGMFVRKEIYAKLKQNQIHFYLSDRIGKKQTSGGDAELCLLARLVGYEIYYSNELILCHFMQKHRLKKSLFLNSLYDKNEAAYYLFVLESLVSKNKIGNTSKAYLLKALKDIAYSMPRIFIGNYRFYNLSMFLHKSVSVFWILLESKTQARIERHIKSISLTH